MKEPNSHFIDEDIEVYFEKPPVRQKTPTCPDGFTWQERDYHVMEKLSEWRDFTRRGRMKRSMSPAHASVAERRGSIGVGRFFFRVQVQTGQVFELYYDRKVRNVDDRLGHWVLYREFVDHP